MKKLLVLLLVLGMASMANAGLIFTVDGAPTENGATIDLLPSEIIELDLELDVDTACGGFTIDYVLSNGLAELIVDGASGDYPDIVDPMTDIEFPASWDFPAGALVLADRVQVTGANMFSADVEGPAVLRKELYLHCLAPGDVLLEIIAQAGTEIDSELVNPGTVLHTLNIHQIPEPMTMSLLGLGGLALLRRRRA